MTALWITRARILRIQHHCPTTVEVGMKTMLQRLARDERGDVPGWVLITLMTAGLVIIIWGLAGPALSGVFEQAIERVTGF